MVDAPTAQVADVTWEQVLAWRMRRQHLLDRAPAGEFEAVVARLGGVHAQVLSCAELALWARTDGLTADAVADALWHRRTLVKLWAMRRTLHLLPAGELGMWLAGLGDEQLTPLLPGGRENALALAAPVGAALRGRVLSRAELIAEVGRRGGAAMAELVGGSWGGSLKGASYLGQLCFGPSDGPRVRFTHPDTWLATAPAPVGRGEALAGIAGRFLAAYGPAAPVDLGAWWGVNRAGAAAMLSALGPALAEVRVEGAAHLMLADDVAELAGTTPSADVVRLLPGFDQWVVCATRRVGPRSRPGPGVPALDPAFRTRVYRQQGWVSPVVLVNGRIAGVWRHERTGRVVRVRIEPFRRLPRWIRPAIEAEAERLADYLGGDLRLAAE